MNESWYCELIQPCHGQKTTKVRRIIINHHIFVCHFVTNRFATTNISISTRGVSRFDIQYCVGLVPIIFVWAE